jgi:hypothetical protein
MTFSEKKLNEWNNKANKIRDNAAKNRIAKWTEDRYRISNARKNWKKLSDLYDLRQRLIKYKTLNDLSDKLRNRFNKSGIDQLKKGINYITLLKIAENYLKMLMKSINY